MRNLKNKNKNKIDKKIKISIVALCCVCLIAFVYIYVLLHKEANIQSPQVRQQNQQIQQGATPYVVPPLTQNYTNTTYGFSLNVPEDFTTRESDINGSHTIVFESPNDDGVQIIIAPYDQKGIKNLTKDMIRSAIPDMKISDDQTVEIGNNYTGLAFKSDNDAFDGDSREVWFIYKDNLYQISTYSRLDDLLKSIFTTWQFK